MVPVGMNDAASFNRAHMVARLGPDGLKPLYDGGVEPSIAAILKYHPEEPTEGWRELAEQIQVEKDSKKMPNSTTFHA